MQLMHTSLPVAPPQSNDVASVLWALGVMRLPLSEEQAAGLLQRCAAWSAV